MKLGNPFFKKPLILAPMEDVTDMAFRRICRRYGADIVYTEFVSAECLIKNMKADIRKLHTIHREERPIGIQIYGNQVEYMVKAAKMAEKAAPSFIDINFGCPTKKVAGKGAGAGLLCQPELMKNITCAVVDAVNLPVTAKTRIGWDDNCLNIEEIAQMLENCGIQALALHGRTRAQKFKGQARWEWIGKAKKSITIPLIGNGDVTTPQDVGRMFELTHCDGVMIGRGALGNPWIFQRARQYLETGKLPPEPSLDERIEVLLEHLSLSIALKGNRFGIVEMGKHYANYLQGVSGLRELKRELAKMTCYQDIRNHLKQLMADISPMAAA